MITRRVSKNILIVGAAVIFLAAAIPLPFKPSLWSAYKKYQLTNQLKKSSDPVYITKVTDFKPSFTIYSKWVNAYDVNVGIQFYQLSPRSVISPDSEGPNREEIDFLQKVQNGSQCARTSDVFSYCEMPATKIASKREFVAVHKDDYKLVAELTTIYYKDGITTKGGYHLNYSKKDDADIKLILDALAAVKPVPVSDAKANYFVPIF